MNITTFCSGAFVGSLLTFVTMCVSYSIKTNKIEEELRQQLEELTEKHWSECRQISEYEAENKRMKEQLNNLIDKYEAKK